MNDIDANELEDMAVTLQKLNHKLKDGNSKQQDIGAQLVAAANELKKDAEPKAFNEKSTTTLPPNYKPRRKFTPRKLPPR